MKKYGYYLICSVILLAILMLCFLENRDSSGNIYPLEFVVEQEDHRAEISIFESEYGEYYVFLPSYADMAALKIVSTVESEVTLGGITVTSGMSGGQFELETPYSLVVDHDYVAQLQFFRSANVATLYIDTATGSMEQVNRDKNLSERASVMLYTADGVRNVSDSAAYIKGRGNSTWYYGKRPYVLTLSSDMDVLGMGEAAKWVLLANAADATNLNNKMVLDLARQTGQVWSPECEYADVYLNGEYNGLYLLAEKVEVGASRLDIDPESGDFLCRTDLEYRWRNLNNPLRTSLARTVEICEPYPLSDSSKTDIAAAVNQMETVMTSGADLSEAENFDLDSWVRKYLLDEISANIDGDLASSYFYCSDGVCYGGPLWDYDKSFGNDPRNMYPFAFLAKNTYKLGEYKSSYYTALYANESFHNRMVELYQSEYLPLLNQWIESGILDMAAQIQSASTMNQLRWQAMFDVIHSWSDHTVHTVEGKISYLKDRVAFLNSAWLEETEYCTVQFGVEYWNFSVRKGQCLVTDYVDLENTVWVDKATGDPVDFSQPVVSDMIVLEQHTYDAQQKPEGLAAIKDFVKNAENLKIVVSILSIILFAGFFICMAFVDFSHRKKERRGTDEPNKPHVSP